MKYFTIIVITSVFLFASCSSMPEQKPAQPLETMTYEGCKIHSANRRKYQKCLVDMQRLWELRENSNGSIQKVEEKRYNDTWVETTYAVCRHDFCTETIIPRRDPTFWGEVKEKGTFMGLGIIIGLVIPLL